MVLLLDGKGQASEIIEKQNEEERGPDDSRTAEQIHEAVMGGEGMPQGLEVQGVNIVVDVSIPHAKEEFRRGVQGRETNFPGVDAGLKGAKLREVDEDVLRPRGDVPQKIEPGSKVHDQNRGHEEDAHHQNQGIPELMSGEGKEESIKAINPHEPRPQNQGSLGKGKEQKEAENQEQ